MSASSFTASSKASESSITLTWTWTDPPAGSYIKIIYLYHRTTGSYYTMDAKLGFYTASTCIFKTSDSYTFTGLSKGVVYFTTIAAMAGTSTTAAYTVKGPDLTVGDPVGTLTGVDVTDRRASLALSLTRTAASNTYRLYFAPVASRTASSSWSSQDQTPGMYLFQLDGLQPGTRYVALAQYLSAAKSWVAMSDELTFSTQFSLTLTEQVAGSTSVLLRYQASPAADFLAAKPAWYVDGVRRDDAMQDLTGVVLRGLQPATRHVVACQVTT